VGDAVGVGVAATGTTPVDPLSPPPPQADSSAAIVMKVTCARARTM
jgi:hypothetical protein